MEIERRKLGDLKRDDLTTVLASRVSINNEALGRERLIPSRLSSSKDLLRDDIP